MTLCSRRPFEFAQGMLGAKNFLKWFSRHFKRKNLLRHGVLAEPVREEVGQVADFFWRFASRGPDKRKRVDGDGKVGKHFTQRARLEILFDAVGRQDGNTQSLYCGLTQYEYAVGRKRSLDFYRR